MYKFRNSTDEERKNSNVGYGDCIYEVPDDKQYALFFGNVRTLFGENDSITDDWECMYTYPITAEDENGNKLYFEIYHGSGGSSISTPYSGELPPNYKQAKEELLELIENTLPADYVWEGVYEDIPENIKYTVKDGKAYVEHDFPEDMDFENTENFT